MNDGRTDKDINNRIKKANQIYYEINNTILGKKEVDPKTKIQIYRSVYIPTLTCGAESWPLTTKHESRIIATGMKFLRRIVGRRKEEEKEDDESTTGHYLNCTLRQMERIRTGT
jgi:hypothetical protein